MRICTKCVLDSSVPNISFDETGVCNFCQTLVGRDKLIQDSHEVRKTKLDAIVGQIKKEGEGKEYDCIIGVSGGVDSSYVSYLVKNLGLRPLAIHLDNGWDAELAVSNIRNLCVKLDIDLYTHVIDWQEFRDLQVSFLKASVANAEAPTDHAIFAILYKMARKYKIKWIVDGVNTATEFPRDAIDAGGGYTYSDLRQILGIHKLFGKIKLKSYPTMSYYKKLFFRHVLKVRQFSILDYVDYDKEKAKELLINQLDWRSYGGKHHESIFTKWHQVVYLPTKFKFDKRKIHLSDLILSKQLTREEALVELSKKAISDEDRRELEKYVVKKLDLTEEEYQKILNATPVSFSQYPNDLWAINLYKQLKKYL
jgi:N-acetyl sugar amidotransferase